MNNLFWPGAFLASFVAVLLGRFTVPGHGLSWPGTYEALAHVWVGVMLALSVTLWHKVEGKACAAALTVLTALETVMFLSR